MSFRVSEYIVDGEVNRSKLVEVVERECGKRMRGTAWRMLGNDADAEDALQTAYFKISRVSQESLPQEPQYLRTWATRVIINVALDIRRSNRRKAKDIGYNDEHASGRIDLPESPRYSSPTKSLENGELRQQMERTLEFLSEKHQQILLLREVEGLAYQKIADVLDISKGTVMSRLHHAREKFKSKYRALYKDPFPGSE